MSAENVERIRTQSERLDLSVINDSILELSKTLADAKWSTQPRILLELSIVKMGTGAGTQVKGAGVGGCGMPSGRNPSARSQTSSPAHVQRASEHDVPPAWQPPFKEETAERSGVERMEPADRPEAAVKPAAEPTTLVATGSGDTGEFDLENLWHRVFEDGEALRGSFNLLRRGTTLVEVGSEAFTVEVGNEMMERFAKDNKAELERFMENRTGRKLHMICRLPAAEGQTGGREEKAKEVAGELSQRLGINVEIR